MYDKKFDLFSKKISSAMQRTFVKSNYCQRNVPIQNRTAQVSCIECDKYSRIGEAKSQSQDINTFLIHKSNYSPKVSSRQSNIKKLKWESFKKLLFVSITASLTFNSSLLSLANAQEPRDTDGPVPTNSPADSVDSAARSPGSSDCFGGLQTFEKISMSSFENPAGLSNGNVFGSGILVQQDDQALTSECVNLCRSQANCLSFVIDYNKFECKSYAITQQELQQEFEAKYQNSRGSNGTQSAGSAEPRGYQAQASTMNFQQLLPSASSNYFEKICLEGIAERNQFNDVCSQGRLWTIERVVDSFLDGFVEKEVTNVNNKDECSKMCIFETQFVCRSADYDQPSRLCRLSKEDRRTQPQAMRHAPGSSRHYLENQCATPGPSSCVYETKKNVGIISMDALKFAQTVQDCQMKCNQESTFNCRSYSFNQQRCFLSGDDSFSLNSNLIKPPSKQGWLFGEKKCIVELCTKGIFSYEKITGYTLRSALSSPIDLMMPSAASIGLTVVGTNIDDLEKLQHESSQTRLQQFLPIFQTKSNASNLATIMMLAANNNQLISSMDPLHESATSNRQQRSTGNNNLAITHQCRHSCDLGYLNCPAFSIDYKNNRCQRLDRNSQGRHQELVAKEGFSYYEKICLRVPEIMSMCQDKYWIFERVIGHELAPRYYEKNLKFVQSRRDCQEYCLEEKSFQCRSALYNDETSDCKLSRHDRRLVSQEGGYYRNFNVRISYLENQCIRDHSIEQRCTYEQARDESAYPTFTEHIEMVPASAQNHATLESESGASTAESTSVTGRHGSAHCERLCNDNAKFQCHSFGYYASTAQCFLSGDDTISAGENATTQSTGFIYYEKKCRASSTSNNLTIHPFTDEPAKHGITPASPTSQPAQENLNPYFQKPTFGKEHNLNNIVDGKPHVQNNNISIHIDQKLNIPDQRPSLSRPPGESMTNEMSLMDANRYKCGMGHTFTYQRISGFEPIGGYLTLLIKDNEKPGIVVDCADRCKRAFECRAFVVDYDNNQCFAMLENSSVGLLSLRQTLGKDYFEGFCVADHILLTGNECSNKTWVMDKIVDQAVIGVQHQKLIPDSDRAHCRQACLEERLFWCKSALFDDATSDCKLYSIDRESVPQMKLLFTKNVDFFENQCQIMSSSCPYDAIERDTTIVSTTKSIQARSTFDCEHSCNSEKSFNCRSYTYIDQYPSLPNVCLLSSDSRSTSQKGSIRDHQRALYAERNCFYRRPRYPGHMDSKPASEPMYSSDPSPARHSNPYAGGPDRRPTIEENSPPRLVDSLTTPNSELEVGPALGQGCEPHQFTFERTLGYDFRLGQKERAMVPPSVGIVVGCQQECLRRGERCLSFVVTYALPYQGCFLIDNQVGSNKKQLVKSPNTAYFEKICLPKLGIDVDQLSHAPLNAPSIDPQSMDIAPSYSHEPWTPQYSSQAPYYVQQQQLVQNYPSRTCAKLWSFERFIGHNFTAPSDKQIAVVMNKVQCEIHCINEAQFSCRAATYDYSSKVCRLFKQTRRTVLSQFVDLEGSQTSAIISTIKGSQIHGSSPPDPSIVGSPQSSITSDDHRSGEFKARPMSARQVEATTSVNDLSPIAQANIDYLENTCVPEPSSCQYRQLYDVFSIYIDKINHAVSLGDCQRQCDSERLFSCKSVNYDPLTKNCMLINEDLISLNRDQQEVLLPKKNTIYSEKSNCEMISVQCNSQEMLVSINFDTPFRGRVMAKGNPEQCFMIGDGQTNLQFPIVFGPKCNSRQEGHNTFVNEVVIQQHPVIMTDSDKTVRVMCAFEAPDQTITLKNPSSVDNKTGIDVGTPESSRTRHDKQHLNSVVSNKAAPPSVLLRIIDQNNRDASMINLGDDLKLKIQMQVDGQNTALGIFARNLVAKSSNGESLLLIDNDGCPVDHLVFPGLEIDPKDGKSLYSNFKAFRFPSSGLVNFEVQIKFCPERCQPVDCNRGHRTRSYGRRKRDLNQESTPVLSRTSILQSIQKRPIEELSTVMKPGKAFQFVRKLFFDNKESTERTTTSDLVATEITKRPDSFEDISTQPLEPDYNPPSTETPPDGWLDSPDSNIPPNNGLDNSVTRPELNGSGANVSPASNKTDDGSPNEDTIQSDGSPNGNNDDPPQQYQKSILMHVDEKVVPSLSFDQPRMSSQPHSPAPYGHFPLPGIELHQRRQGFEASTEIAHPHIARDPANEISSKDNQRQFPINDQLSRPDVSAALSVSSPEQTPEQTSHANSGHGLDVSDSEGKISPLTNEATDSSEKQDQSKDMPLRFSILVAENQAPNQGGWSPSSHSPVLVKNSTSVDHIVVPGKYGQFEHIATGQPDKVFGQSSSEQLNVADTNSTQQLGATKQNLTNSIVDMDGKKGAYEQNLDTLSSNSIEAEIKLHQPLAQAIGAGGGSMARGRQSIAESAATHKCQTETSAGTNRLWTLIWTGTFIIAVNVCLVVFSLVLYFRKVHLRQNHSIVRATSECRARNPTGRYRWPSVLLKSKHNLGTSLNTHEHFFYKLNAKNGPNENNGPKDHDFNWPNLSSSSSHSTISSLASPLPASVRINQAQSRRPGVQEVHKLHRPSLRNNGSRATGNDFMSGHKNILHINSSLDLGSSYPNNIDEPFPGDFQPLR